jgi:hypothetical protein
MKPPQKCPKISLRKTVKATMATANSVPLDALDLDKNEAVIHAKKTPSYQRWLETHDGDFFTYAHRSYKKGDQSYEEKLIASIIRRAEELLIKHEDDELVLIALYCFG